MEPNIVVVHRDEVAKWLVVDMNENEGAIVASSVTSSNIAAYLMLVIVVLFYLLCLGVNTGGRRR